MQFKLFVAEGVKIVNELLLSDYKIHTIFSLDNEKSKNNIQINFPAKLHDKISFIDQAELQSISALTTPDNFLVLAEVPESMEIPTDSEVVIGLDGIRDPGNLGTIIRTADWFGINNIICSEDCVDCYNSKVVQSSMGSLFRVNIVYKDLLQFIRDHNYYVYSTAINGKILDEIHFKTPALILIGNESHGLRSELINLSGEIISISKFGLAESLNASVAAGIVINAFRKQIK